MLGGLFDIAFWQELLSSGFVAFIAGGFLYWWQKRRERRYEIAAARRELEVVKRRLRYTVVTFAQEKMLSPSTMVMPQAAAAIRLLSAWPLGEWHALLPEETTFISLCQKLVYSYDAFMMLVVSMHTVLDSAGWGEGPKGRFLLGRASGHAMVTIVARGVCDRETAESLELTWERLQRERPHLIGISEQVIKARRAVEDAVAALQKELKPKQH